MGEPPHSEVLLSVQGGASGTWLLLFFRCGCSPNDFIVVEIWSPCDDVRSGGTFKVC